MLCGCRHFVLIWAHLRNKVRAENKRKIGLNPFKMANEYEDEAYALQIESHLNQMGYEQPQFSVADSTKSNAGIPQH